MLLIIQCLIFRNQQATLVQIHGSRAAEGKPFVMVVTLTHCEPEEVRALNCLFDCATQHLVIDQTRHIQVLAGILPYLQRTH